MATAYRIPFLDCPQWLPHVWDPVQSGGVKYCLMCGKMRKVSVPMDIPMEYRVVFMDSDGRETHTARRWKVKQDAIDYAEDRIKHAGDSVSSFRVEKDVIELA